MKTTRYPLISIGIPVYNGEPFIAQTLDSLLAQDYENLELIISDNASTDKTAAICKHYATRDIRIRYDRNHENLGAVRNFNRTFQLSHGEYFMWAGAHDLWDQAFISTCLSEILDDPEVVLCGGAYREIDEKGTPIKIEPTVDTRGMKPAERLRCVMHNSPYAVYSLIRTETLRRTHLFAESYAGDRLLLAELSLLGEFRYTPNVSTYFRIFRDRYFTEDQNLIRLFGPSATKMNGTILRRFPCSHSMLGMCRVIYRAHLPFGATTYLISDVVTKYKVFVLKEVATRWWPRCLRHSLKKKCPGVYRAWQGLGENKI